MTEKFAYFWNGPFSQWAPSPFTVFGEKYNCAEQYMMAEKARVFKDWATADKIMSAHTPDLQKSLGRTVKPFDEVIWDKVCCRIVYTGNYFKFTQNPEYLSDLMATKGHTLVEASPYDTIWGIGLSMHDDRANDRATWRGKNYLGEILTKLREDLIDNSARILKFNFENHND